ncbi:MAG TPA: tyrosine-type recombinase/integrase, partial [Polyangiaceae bacterium]
MSQTDESRDVTPERSSPLERHIVAFVAYLSEERRYSKHTSSEYRRDLFMLQQFIQARLKRSARIGDIDKLTLRAWLGEMAATVSTPTLARRLSTVRSFFKFAQQRGRVRSNPCAELRAPKVRRKFPSFVSVDQAQQIVEAPILGLSETAAQLRDAAALELLYGCGLRVSELVALNLGDISVERRELRVSGKGRKERMVPLGSKAALAIERYLPHRSELSQRLR